MRQGPHQPEYGLVIPYKAGVMAYFSYGHQAGYADVGYNDEPLEYRRPLSAPDLLWFQEAWQKAWDKAATIGSLTVKHWKFNAGPRDDLALEVPPDFVCGPVRIKWREVKRELKDTGYIKVSKCYTQLSTRSQIRATSDWTFPCRKFMLGGLTCYVPDHPKNKNRFWI